MYPCSYVAYCLLRLAVSWWVDREGQSQKHIGSLRHLDAPRGGQLLAPWWSCVAWLMLGSEQCSFRHNRLCVIRCPTFFPLFDSNAISRATTVLLKAILIFLADCLKTKTASLMLRCLRAHADFWYIFIAKGGLMYLYMTFERPFVKGLSYASQRPPESRPSIG
jgi:hypothetical protein